jgi:hypothetical protein
MAATTLPGREQTTLEDLWEYLKKSSEEHDQRMKELDQQMKETERIIGKLGNRFGELIEHLVGPNIREKFNALGFNFTRVARDCEVKDPDSPHAITEVDIQLENGDIVIAVEVKAKPKEADVDEHVRRMERLRRAADRSGDRRKYRGAIAGAIIDEALRRYILQTGFYMIQQTGDTVQITIPPGFIPREW